jgi:site-specific DNA recombinase
MEVAVVLGRRWRYSPLEKKTTPKAFLGLLHCATCGGAISAEIQKGHTYYRCTKKGRLTSWCQQPYIREEALDAEITTLLRPFELPSSWADQMLALLADEKKSDAQAEVHLAAQKRTEAEGISGRLKKLLDALLDGVIDRSEYTAEKAELMSQKKTVEEQTAAISTGRAKWPEPFKNWVLTAKNTGEIAVSGSFQEERGLASKIFGSNLVLDCKKARGSCVKPWSLLLETSQTGGVVPATGLESTPLLRESSQ